MTIVKHELKQSSVTFIIWTWILGLMLAICVLIYPEMKDQMSELSDSFSSMGSFSSAFGMDKLNFGTLTGYYVTECGNTLGLGGAFFAALCGIGILCKEEQNHTAEFLLSHPVTRVQIITEKLISIFIQISVLNLLVYAFSMISILAIGEDIAWTDFALLHLAFYLLQIEIAGICFGLSAFLRKGSLGIGLGIAAIMYFLNIIANITEDAEFLKFITPFGYAEGADIVNNGCLEWGKVVIGMVLCTAGIVAAYLGYTRKDLQ